MRILVVEDDITSNELLCRMLVKEGFIVTPAFDGFEAINFMKLQKFDLIVSDVSLGSSPDGFQVYKASKESGINDFILYTSSSMPSLADLAEALGILTFISGVGADLMSIKSAVVERLNEAVRRNTEITNKLLNGNP